MFGAKARRIAELVARNAVLAETLNASRTEADQHLGATVRASRAFACADDEVARLRDRLGLMLLITRRQRRWLRRDKRTITRLQTRLDDALGLNKPSVVAGAQWQDRRIDKVGGAK
jgi:hypothetical protein